MEYKSFNTKSNARQRTYDKYLNELKGQPPCSVVGCSKAIRSISSGLCEAHYYRKRRTGQTGLKDRTPPKEIINRSGYILEFSPDHPIANDVSGSRVYQHRRVYYDNHGNKGLSCHWCSTELTWARTEIDHVNAIKTDNRIENLVASCGHCNRSRGVPKMTDTQRLNSSQRFTHRGETMASSEWADRIGISRSALLWRIKKGWPLSEALTKGRGKHGPQAKANR